MKKTGNIQFIIFVSVIVLIFVFFFTSPIWIGDSRKNKTSSYDETMNISAYSIKVNGAMYDALTKTLQVNFFEKENSENKSNPPEITGVSLGDNTGEYLDYSIEKMPSSVNAFGSYITVKNVPEDFYYIRIYVNVKDKDVQPPNTIDEFGNLVHPKIKKGQEYFEYISIDYRDVKKGIAEYTGTIYETVTEILPPETVEITTTTEALLETAAVTVNTLEDNVTTTVTTTT